MRLQAAVAAAVIGLAGSAAANDGLAPAGGIGRAGARAGAGAAAADDAFAMTRNPAALARRRRFELAGGLRGTGWRFQPTRVPGRARTQTRVLGGLDAAIIWPLGVRAAGSRRDPFAVPVRAGLAWQARTGEGEIRAVIDSAPKLIEVRARGGFADVRSVTVAVEPVGGGDAVATRVARGGLLQPVDFGTVVRWPAPEWPPGRAQVVVRYRFRFRQVRDGATEGSDRIDVRLDVDGREAGRAVHTRPAPAPAKQPDGTGSGGAGAPDDGAGAAEPADPDARVVRRLERGGWRLGLALETAALAAGSAEAPGRISGYSMGLVTEAGHVTLARSFGSRFSVGVGAQIYASAITGLEMPVTVPDGFGGTQPGALEIEAAPGAGLGFSAGVLVDPCHCLTIGLHYRSKAHMRDYRGTAEIRGLSIFGAGNPGATTGEWDVEVDRLSLPQRAGAALAWRPLGDRLLIAVDVDWWDWSDEINRVRLVLENGDQPAFLATGTQALQFEIPLNWEDRFTVAAGATVRVAAPLLLHAGYSWGRNPYRLGTVHPLFPAVVKHHVAAGLTIKIGDLVGDAGASYGFQESVRVTGAPGLNGTRLRVSEFSARLSLAWRF